MHISVQPLKAYWFILYIKGTKLGLDIWLSNIDFYFKNSKTKIWCV